MWIITVEIRNIWDTCNIFGNSSINNSSVLVFFFISAFFTFSSLIFRFRRNAARYFYTTNSSSWRPIRRKNRYRAKTRIGDRRDRYRSRSQKTYGTFAAPRKRSMSLLADSWRSTEPGTLKRKLNEISNRQELPRIGPIKPPPVPRTYTRVY